MAKLSIAGLELKGKRVFIRVDFNVPLKGGRIEDDTRIRATLPTIAYALDHGATAVLETMSVALELTISPKRLVTRTE